MGFSNAIVDWLFDGPSSKRKNNSRYKAKRPSIPQAVREQAWLMHMGQKYNGVCPVKWCSNIITVWDFHLAHDVPFSKGGTYDLKNLIPTCSRCNLSMSNKFTVRGWANLVEPPSRGSQCKMN